MCMMLNQRGFSVVEVLVAMTVLLLVVVAFAPLVMQGFSEVFRAWRLSQALQQAESEMQSLQQKEDGEQITIFDDIDVRLISGEVDWEGEKAPLTIIVLD